MSLPHIPDPMPGDAAAADAIEMVIVPRARDLGNFEVRRALPAAGKQMVGPFIFFDQFGPVVLKAGQPVDVRPHPHIGLSTVTWLFEGGMYHRDSLGLRPVDRTRRTQLDDGRQGHRPFGAHRPAGPRAGPHHVRHPELGGAAEAA